MILQSEDIVIEIKEYLKEPPSERELREIVSQLGIPVKDIIRTNEKIFKENFKGKDIKDEEWYGILSANPILIERPIVVKGDQAVLGRPPEKVHELLK